VRNVVTLYYKYLLKVFAVLCFPSLGSSMSSLSEWKLLFPSLLSHPHLWQPNVWSLLDWFFSPILRVLPLCSKGRFLAFSGDLIFLGDLPKLPSAFPQPLALFGKHLMETTGDEWLGGCSLLRDILGCHVHVAIKIYWNSFTWFPLPSSMAKLLLFSQSVRKETICGSHFYQGPTLLAFSSTQVSLHS
jgi:hypothetical protein